MTETSAVSDRLQPLLAAMLDGQLTGEQIAELRRLLADDPAARRQYVRQVATHGMLQWIMADVQPSSFTPRPSEPVGAAVELPHQPTVALPRQPGDAGPAPLIAPIIIDTGDPLDAPRFTLHSPLGGWLLSYTAATVITGMAILGAWLYKVSHDYQLASPSRPATAIVAERETQPELVGRITGMADCCSADPQDTPSAAVPLGRKYALNSGLMEITYQSGAKVILQGPCIFEVESPRGGFLSLGRLTARVEKNDECGMMNDELKTPNPNTHHSSFITHHLFSVRTPAATITDLGTEFGVEVDRSGATRSHVFRGKVELRVARGNGAGAERPILLGEDESATVEAGRNPVVRVIPGVGRSNRFARQMPHRVPIKLWNTGVGLHEGDEDPHWQIVARSDDPKFKPRPAVVTTVNPHPNPSAWPPDDPTWMANDPALSQWISTAGNQPNLPNCVTYTFCTTFEVMEMLPGSAVLEGVFIVDDRVVAIRLNGEAVRVPVLAHESKGMYRLFQSFTARNGFVEGANRLEIDVLNDANAGDPALTPPEGTTRWRSACNWKALLLPAIGRRPAAGKTVRRCPLTALKQEVRS